MPTLKKFFSVLFAKETLIKIILVQVIVLLFKAIDTNSITFSHRGYIDLGSQSGGVELQIRQ